MKFGRNAAKVKGGLANKSFVFKAAWVMPFLDKKAPVFERHCGDIVRYALFGTKPLNEMWREPLQDVFSEIDKEREE